jgi:hypothetical protein
MNYKPDNNTQKIKKWINKSPGANGRRLRGFLLRVGQSEAGVTHTLLSQEFAELRKSIVGKFKIK